VQAAYGEIKVDLRPARLLLRHVFRYRFPRCIAFGTCLFVDRGSPMLREHRYAEELIPKPDGYRRGPSPTKTTGVHALALKACRLFSHYSHIPETEGAYRSPLQCPFPEGSIGRSFRDRRQRGRFCSECGRRSSRLACDLCEEPLSYWRRAERGSQPRLASRERRLYPFP
jgi:hypothetical protein